jgi:S1-C subfamily serine protease
VHTLSYQEARAFHRPMRGVFVAASGYIFDAAGVPRGAIITELDSKPIDTLADFSAASASSATARARRALRHHRRSQHQPAALDTHRPALVSGAPVPAR